MSAKMSRIDIWHLMSGSYFTVQYCNWCKYPTHLKNYMNGASFSSQHLRQGLLQWRSVTASGPAESMERWGKMEQLGRVAVRFALVWWVTVIHLHQQTLIIIYLYSIIFLIVGMHNQFLYVFLVQYSVVSPQLLCSIQYFGVEVFIN